MCKSFPTLVANISSLFVSRTVHVATNVASIEGKRVADGLEANHSIQEIAQDILEHLGSDCATEIQQEITEQTVERSQLCTCMCDLDSESDVSDVQSAASEIPPPPPTPTPRMQK